MSQEKNILDPRSRDYFDIRLFSVMAHACRLANDNKLAFIFFNLMRSLGSTYSCDGEAAIEEGKKYVDEIIQYLQMKTLQINSQQTSQYAVWIIAENAKNADFSGIRMYQEKQLKNGASGVDREGIEEVNKMIFDILEKYKEYPSIRDVI